MVLMQDNRADNFTPQYGDIDDRVRAVCHAMGLTPVIWTSSGETDFDTDGKWQSRIFECFRPDGCWPRLEDSRWNCHWYFRLCRLEADRAIEFRHRYWLQCVHSCIDFMNIVLIAFCPPNSRPPA